MAYLKSRITGEVFPMNEHLLKRGDMVEVDSLDAELPSEVEDVVVLATPTPKTRAAKPRTPKPVTPTIPEGPSLDDLEVPEVE